MFMGQKLLPSCKGVGPLEQWTKETRMGKLVGTDPRKILTEAERLLRDGDFYGSMAKKAQLFGDGHAAERIVKILGGAFCR